VALGFETEKPALILWSLGFEACSFAALSSALQFHQQAARRGDGFGEDFEVEAFVEGMGAGVGRAETDQERVGAEGGA